MTTSPTLPAPTDDRVQARADLAEHGYCLIGDALTAEQTRALRSRLVELGEAEIADGTDYVYEGGANQRIWTLLNKGEIFVDLALHPLAMEYMGHILGQPFLLSNIDANIAGPGGPPMFLHADQSFMPPPWAYPAVANIMWMLDEFRPENGATRVVPGSHKLQRGPDYGPDVPDTVPVCGPAGTAMVFEGRLWHQTGANVTADQRRHGILAYYCRPFMRQQENWFLSIDPQVLEAAPRQLRSLLGYDLFLSLGMVDGMPRRGPRF